MKELWKTVFQFFLKLNILQPDDPAMAALAIYLKRVENLQPYKNLHTIVYTGFVLNWQNSKAPKTSFSG